MMSTKSNVKMFAIPRAKQRIMARIPSLQVIRLAREAVPFPGFRLQASEAAQYNPHSLEYSRRLRRRYCADPPVLDKARIGSEAHHCP